jgi:predicted GIY-YIG superfamily endonuclease
MSYNGQMASYCLYFLLNDGCIDYVGSTKRLVRRLWEHKHEGKIFNGHIALHLDKISKEQAQALEVLFIQTYKPKQNKKTGSNPMPLERALEELELVV